MRTKNLFKSMLVAICCVSVFAFVSCSDDDDDTVTLKTNPEKIEILTEKTGEAKITNGATPYTVVSSDVKLATAKVDKDVITVTGVKEGKVIINITDKNNSKGKLEVTVLDAAKTLTFDKKSIEVKATESSIVTIQNGAAPYTAVVKDETIATATIEADKVTIKGVKAGTTTITVTDKDKKSGTISVTIK